MATAAHIGAGASRNGLAVAAVQVPERQVAAGMSLLGDSFCEQGP